MSSLDIRLSFVLGSKVEQIRNSIEQIESLHLGLFINSLMYENDEDGRKKKSEFLRSITNSIKVVNHEIRVLNKISAILKKQEINFESVMEIDLSKIESIVVTHKGDYPRDKNASSVDEILGEGDSSRVLAIKHTALRIGNIILPTKMSIKDFVKSLYSQAQVAEIDDKVRLRPSTQKELEKIKTAYSVGLYNESLFMTGRLLEHMVRRYLFNLKTVKKLPLTYKQIEEMSFHKKIECLKTNTNIVNESQYSKLMSVKWDRNVFGHKCIEAELASIKPVIQIGFELVYYLDKHLANTKKLKSSTK